MQKKLLAISTSPRTHGNSDSAVDLLIDAVGSHFSVEKVSLKSVPFSACRGCGFCEKEGECIQKDGFIPLMEKLISCDVLVFASPVYALSVCAQAKAVIDRCQALWARKYLLKTIANMPDKRGVFISTAGQTYPEVFDHTVPVARFLFDVSGVRNANMQYVLLKGLDKKQDFSKSDEAKEAVLQAAAELVKNMDG